MKKLLAPFKRCTCYAKRGNHLRSCPRYDAFEGVIILIILTLTCSFMAAWVNFFLNGGPK